MKSKRHTPGLNSKKSGKFKPGCSGNPAGRPKGIPDKRTQLRALLEPSKDKLIAKAVNLALRGNVHALKLCLERLIPIAKATGEPVSIDIPAGSLSEQAQAIFKEAVTGQLTGEDAKTLTDLLASRLNMIQVEEIEQRLRILEKSLGDKGGGTK